MNRRHLLLSCAGFALCGGFAAGTLTTSGSEVAGVAAIIFKRLGYLKLHHAGVWEFARDYAAKSLISARKLRAVSVAGRFYNWVPESWFDALTSDIRYGEERIVTTFLLSSDFFPRADEKRTVRYRELFDAQRHVNPFARLRFVPPRGSRE